MAHLGPFEDHPSLGVAVSGGSDSLALVFLLHAWVKLYGGTLRAFHVDHKLRPTSTEEASRVKSWLQNEGILCHILTWFHDSPPTTSLQEEARKIRYHLLDKACLDYGILHLAVAHHNQDQQETYLFRQQAQSTEYGLAAMSAVIYFGNCRLIRPLLTFKKKELRETLGNHPYLEDPSNQNLRFRRAQLRQQPHHEIDLSSYQENRREEEKQTARFLAIHVEIAKEGYAKLPLSVLENASPKIIKRALGLIIRCIGNLNYFPSPKAVNALYNKLNQTNYSTASLGRCIVSIRQKKIWVIPDLRTLPPVKSLLPNEKIWGRFFFKGAIPLNTTIKPLGPQGWHQIKSYVKTPLPYNVVITFPSYWVGEKVTSVPFLKFHNHDLNYPPFLYEPKNSLLAELFV